MQRHDWQNLVNWNRLTEAIDPAEYVARRNRYMRNRTLDHAPAALVDDINRASDDMDKAINEMNRFIDVILDMPQITSRQNSEHAAYGDRAAMGNRAVMANTE